MAQDPKHAGPTPPQPEQQQEPPGHTAKMTPESDHGEEFVQRLWLARGSRRDHPGGDLGISRGVAIVCAREGADVLISYLREEEDNRETARWVEQSGAAQCSSPAISRNSSTVRALFERAVSEFGKPDILVNNAAFQRTYDEIEDISAEEWDRIFRVNVYSMFYLSQAAVPHMRPGAIVNTTSICS